MEMGPSAARHGPLSALVGHLELGVQGCQAELLASTLATLGPFLEDELSADVQPMKIHLDNVTITLKVSWWHKETMELCWGQITPFDVHPMVVIRGKTPTAIHRRPIK